MTKSRLILITGAMAIFGRFATAQVAPAGVSVRLVPQHLYMGGLGLVTEFPVKGNWRLMAGMYGYFGKPYSEMLKDSVVYTNFSGAGLNLVPRLYLGSGERTFSASYFYLAPFAAYRFWNARVEEYAWAEVQRPDQLWYLEYRNFSTSQKIERIDFGAGLGLQRLFGNRFELDFFAGPGISNTRIVSDFPVMRYHVESGNEQFDYRYAGIYFAFGFQLGITLSPAETALLPEEP